MWTWTWNFVSHMHNCTCITDWHDILSLPQYLSPAIESTKKLCYCRGTARRTCQQKFCNYKISLSCGIICVILRLAVFTQYRSVTDTHTHRDGWTIHDDSMYCVSIASRGKNRPYCTAQCPPSIITRQRASVDSKLLGRPRNVGY